MFVATSFCRALNKSIYLSSCPATGCSIAVNLEQMVGQTASHLKSAERLGQSRWTFGAAANFWRRPGIAECSIGARSRAPGAWGPYRQIARAACVALFPVHTNIYFSFYSFSVT